MTEEEQEEEQEHENKRIRPRERALGQKKKILLEFFSLESPVHSFYISS